MLIKEWTTDVEVPGPEGGEATTMRLHVFEPVAAGAALPGLVLFSEIYQVTGPIERLGRQLAAEGFVVAAPEVYHELLTPGRVLAYNPEETDLGNRLKVSKPVEQYDRDASAAIEWLLNREDSNNEVGVIGMCLGGHLALRAAFHPAVKAGVCLFATDVHSGTLGESGDDTISNLARLAEAEMVFVWGKQDNHVPMEGRQQIKDALEESGAGFSWLELNAQHAFIRDELSKGRYDASLAQICMITALELFRRRLWFKMPQQREVKPQADAPGPAKC